MTMTGLSRLAALGPVVFLVGCTGSVLRPDVREIASDAPWTDRVSLRVSCYDESRKSSHSFDEELQSLVSEPSDYEEFRPFDEQRFWMTIRSATPEKILLSVRLDDRPAEDFELLLGERRAFRPDEKNKRISFSFYESRVQSAD